MEKEKKPHTFLKLFIGFLLGIAITIGGLYAAKSFNLLDKFIKCDNKEVKETKQEETKDEVTEQSYTVTNFYPDSVAILNNGKVYVNVYGSSQQLEELFGDGAYQTLTNTRKNYSPLNIQNLKVQASNEELKVQELAINDVVGIYVYEAGQTINNNYSLLLVKKDGSVEIISLYSLISGRTKTTEVKGLENISYFTSKDSDGVTTYAIDKDGNEININNMISDNYKDY